MPAVPILHDLLKDRVSKTCGHQPGRGGCWKGKWNARSLCGSSYWIWFICERINKQSAPLQTANTVPGAWLYTMKPGSIVFDWQEVCQGPHRVLKVCKIGEGMKDVLGDVVKDVGHPCRAQWTPVQNITGRKGPGRHAPALVVVVENQYVTNHHWFIESWPWNIP